ncbi:hypothetical protein, partial [Mycobacterium marinum]|uniref:hypothetical protein n=1 Tax=Mycobacterium marinum TaxID=1781 RepID=UPI001CA5A176
MEFSGDRKPGDAGRRGSPPTVPAGIASPATPGAAGHHHQLPRGSQARRRRAPRVTTNSSRGDRKPGDAGRRGSPPTIPAGIASPATPGAAGHHQQFPWGSQARRRRAPRVTTINSRGDRKPGDAGRRGSPPTIPVGI